MPFDDQLEARELGPREWELTAQLRYHGNTDTFTVPIGFRTDFASVPRLFWSFIGPTGLHTRAAVLHDWLYVEAPLVKGTKPGTLRRITREEADGLFLRVLREAGVSTWKSVTMHRAVRWFGRKVWNKARARRG